jgi:hypothetical protein
MIHNIIVIVQYNINRTLKQVTIANEKKYCPQITQIDTDFKIKKIRVNSCNSWAKKI